jgi:hypothetical protein
VTHDDAIVLLPDYALGALDDSAELEAHLDDCARCRAELATLLETTARLGAATPLQPPSRLRDAVLAYQKDTTRFGDKLPWWKTRFPLVAAAALLVVSLGLGGTAVVQREQLQTTQAHLATDESGLALLTSTETIVERLEPAGDLAAPSHGHWFHRSGVSTQVFVVESMPPPPAGLAYVAWYRRDGAGWTRAGAFTLDGQGYGRIIEVDANGDGVGEVEVVRQPPNSTTLDGTVVLHWTAVPTAR